MSKYQSKYQRGEIITYEGRIWDVSASGWDTIDRGAHGDQPRARFKVVSHVLHADPDERVNVEFVQVTSADWPEEPYEYMIFDLDKIEREGERDLG